MPDIDPLAFGIRFALTHETVGREARKLIRSLTEHQLEHLCNQVAKHLRLSGWQQRQNRKLLRPSSRMQRVEAISARKGNEEPIRSLASARLGVASGHVEAKQFGQQRGDLVPRMG
jgi:hypothetical protein